AFQILAALAYVVPDWLAAARRRSREEDWALQIVVPWLLFVALHRVVGEFHPEWMGSLALLFAMVWTLFAAAATRPRFVADPMRPLLIMATALAFIGLSFPLQARAYWAAAGWTAEGAALWWLGLRIRTMWLRGASAAFL